MTLLTSIWAEAHEADGTPYPLGQLTMLGPLWILP